MNKAELMKNYTAEQLAEMVVKKEKEISKLKKFEYMIRLLELSGLRVRLSEKENPKDEDEIMNFEIIQTYADDQKLRIISELDEKYNSMQSKVEKYRKAFEEAKKERDCQIAEYQKKIEELMAENDRLKGDVDGMNYQEKQDKTNNFYGMYAHSAKDLTKDDLLMFLGILTKELIANGVDFRYEMEKELKVWDIKIKGDENITNFLPTEPIKIADMLINAHKRDLYENSAYYSKIFGVSELRQIAEHLLVYCNHNVEAEE